MPDKHSVSGTHGQQDKRKHLTMIFEYESSPTVNTVNSTFDEPLSVSSEYGLWMIQK